MIYVGIIGTGDMGRDHIKAFNRIDGCQVTAVFDTDAQRARSVAKAFNIPHVYTNLEALLGAPDLAAVANVTPDAFHAPVTLQALAAGKHVLCEKPLALNYPEAQAMAAAAEASGLVHMVNFSYRRAAALQHAHTLVHAGTLGEVRHFEASYLQSWLTSSVWGDWRTEPRWLWRLSTAHGSQGVLGDIGVHLLDFASFPIAPFRSVQCRLKTFDKAPGGAIGPYTLDANDSATILAELDNGALGTLHLSRWATGYENTLRLAVYGTEGAVRINLDTAYDALDVCTGPGVDAVTWQTVACPPVPNNHERFIAAIAEGAPAQPDFHRGAAIQQVLDACFESDATGLPVQVAG